MFDNTLDWSVPETDILAKARTLRCSSTDAVLATIVAVEGNAYRRPGAKMVITREGSGTGSITAGCLEDEIIESAAAVLEDTCPRIERYDLMEDDDVWGLGVGCNGIVDVLLEPITESIDPVISAYESRTAIGVVTVLSSEHESVTIGDRAYFYPERGFCTDGSIPESMTAGLDDAATELVNCGRGSTATITHENQSIDVFIDGIAVPPAVVVLGTGHDVRPVAELANKTDFEVTVIGFRGATATEDRFPHADAVLSTSPATVRETHDFDENTYVVVMTHNFVDDRLAIGELLETRVPYVGLMGPRDRFEEMLEAFADDGRTLNDLERIYTPVGLDLGGGSPYQIAHSIVAELLAVHNDRSPGHLKARTGPIHDRTSPSSADE